MKKRLLQIGSLLMALVVLFISVGWDVKFHYCTEDHHMMGSFGDAAADCVHCLGHDHEHEMEASLPLDVVQYNAKCCCDDFDSKVQFTDNFVFSPDKHLIVNLQSIILPICTRRSCRAFTNTKPTATWWPPALTKRTT